MNIVPGGRVGTNGIDGGLEGQDSSIVNMSGGVVEGGFSTFTAESVLNLTGGAIGGTGINFIGNGQLLVSGGGFSTNTFVGSNATAGISGGVFESQLRIRGMAQATISGGSFEDSIFALDTSAITIFGSGFNFPLGELTASSGTLADGTPLNVDFARASTATITLIPEPSTALRLAAGLVGLGVDRREWLRSRRLHLRDG